jgi:hypothetical protein
VSSSGAISVKVNYRSKMNKIEYEQALLDGSVFVQPEDVVRHPTLSREQKIKILRRWKYDASELSVATEEGMPDRNSDLLRRILVTLSDLTGLDLEHTSSTKQYCIPRSAVNPK